jgi:outer membrane biosynthesis protein TonB
MLFLRCNGRRLSKKQHLLCKFFLFSGAVHALLFVVLLLIAKRSALVMIDLHTLPLHFCDFISEERASSLSCVHEAPVMPIAKPDTRMPQKKVAPAKKTEPVKKKPAPPPVEKKKREPVRKKVTPKEAPKKKEALPATEAVKKVIEKVQQTAALTPIEQQPSLTSAEQMAAISAMDPVALEMEIVKNEILASWKRPAYIPPTTTCTIEIELTLNGEKKVEVIEASPSYALNTLALHFATNYPFPQQLWGKKVRVIF